MNEGCNVLLLFPCCASYEDTLEVTLSIFFFLINVTLLIMLLIISYC